MEQPFHARQAKLLNCFAGKLASSKWVASAKCSANTTASRDIQALSDQNILVKDTAAGSSTSY